jgi:hypothetical protein
MAILPFRKVNYATKLWAGKCDIPFWVYVETAFPCLLQMWFRYITFGQSDMLRMKFGRSQAKWTDKLFRKMSRYTPKYNFKGKKFFLKIDGVLQRIFFIWLLADIAAEGFYTFTTLVHQAGNCDPAFGGGTLQRTQTFDVPTIGNTGWGAFPFASVQQNSGNWLDSALDVQLPPGNYVAAMGVTFRLDASDPVGVATCEIRFSLDGLISSEHWPSGSQDIGSTSADFAASAEFTVPENTVLRFHWSQHCDRNAHIVYEKGDLVVSRVSEIEVIG